MSQAEGRYLGSERTVRRSLVTQPPPLSFLIFLHQLNAVFLATDFLLPLDR